MALRGRKGGLACGKELELCWGWRAGGWAMEMGVAWRWGPRAGVDGGVEDGVGLSTTHILGSSQRGEFGIKGRKGA